MIIDRNSTTNPIVFLHIGKNAGTQITYVSQQLAKSGIRIEKSSHSTKLKKIDKGVLYFFSIRDPISRFRSGFYSRKRKGQPRTYVEWSKYEAFAFGKFEHANDLAESLFRKDELGLAATKAISSIFHTAMHQIDWFERVLNFELRPPVWIIRQERFKDDLEILLRKLNSKLGIDDLIITTDPKLTHENDYAGVPDLSELGKANLRSWYSRDFAFYDLCIDWISRNSDPSYK